jgi:CUG-BP- and ETR3-like factor
MDRNTSSQNALSINVDSLTSSVAVTTAPLVGPTPEWPPSSESVKLFVGQVPKHFEEEDLRPYLERYGPIQELTILRHRATRMHKGCAFVTYCSQESAEQAQKDLHDKVILPSVSDNITLLFVIL